MGVFKVYIVDILQVFLLQPSSKCVLHSKNVYDVCGDLSCGGRLQVLGEREQIDEVCFCDLTFSAGECIAFDLIQHHHPFHSSEILHRCPI